MTTTIAETTRDALATSLRAVIKGEVKFDDGSRALYATDASNYRQLPVGVVVPRDIDDVVNTVAACRRFDVPVLSRGGGTSLAGQCCNVAVVMDFSRHLNRVLSVDAARKLARVEPGCILDNLRVAAEKHGLTFGPDPATHSHNTLGGMIGNDSCGIRSVMAANEGDGARTADNVESLDILLYDGTRMTVGKTSEHELEEIIRTGGRRGELYGALRSLRDRYAHQISQRFPDIPRRVSGFNLPYLLAEHQFNVARALVGSEGTCVTVLEATVNLVNNPRARSLVVFGYPDVYSAGDHVTQIIPHKPTGLEGIDGLLIEYMKKKGMHPQNLKMLPEGDGFLLVEFGGDSKDEADEKARNLMAELDSDGEPPSMKLFDDPEEEKLLWAIRESGLGATADIPGEPSMWPGWEDSAVPPEKVGIYLRELHKLFDKYGYEASLYGHFGQGCIHCRIPFDLFTKEGVANFRRFVEEAARLVVSLGGSLSGEHGDGQSRAELLPIMFGDEIVDAFRQFKFIFDPGNCMNPGKVVDPYLITENLRLGTDYNPPQWDTHFSYPDDDGAFSDATLRCVGVGKCRREGGGTMCPSYMVTHEEEHSTRGRARLLFEMLDGTAIRDGWKSEAVKEALDLCLACKGCKSDCPVNVDMATYKAEFLSHYYASKRRPRQAYAFGFIRYWARAASWLPLIVNAITKTPGVRRLAQLAAGMAPERTIPQFAPQTFRRWFASHRPDSSSIRQREKRSDVLLWTDTFNNHFHPATAIAAVEVLEDAGFNVRIPADDICCGRPLYDYGFLGSARKWLRQTLDSLHDDIAAGTPMVVLEPSCGAVFRDELTNLFPNDEDAKRLKKQTFLLSEFLEQKATDYVVPTLKRKALVQGHCHHKSIMTMVDEESVMKKMGLDYDCPDTGCCGMAGAFGFEAGRHYDVSVKAGERKLLPLVRTAERSTIVVADGFSCREQISQTTERRALHLAQVLQMALCEGESGPTGLPERSAIPMSVPATEVLKSVAVASGALFLVGKSIMWGVSGLQRRRQASRRRSRVKPRTRKRRATWMA